MEIATMTRMSQAPKIEIATKLRDVAVDLVANHGQMTAIKKGADTVIVMTYEDDHYAILYKTPKADLSVANVPEWVNPKGFMIDVWFDNAKKMSVQWDNDGPIEILVFKPGCWETGLARLAPAGSEMALR
jgi:hypothetical protein